MSSLGPWGDIAQVLEDAGFWSLEVRFRLVDDVSIVYLVSFLAFLVC